MRSPINRPPNGQWPDEQWEEAVRQRARELVYPPTPQVAEQVIAHLGERGQGRSRQLQPLWVVSLILALLIGLWAVPPVRAAILEFLQIGAVRIWLVEPTPTPTSTPTEETSSGESAPTVQPSPTPLRSLFDLAGETTLAEAEEKAGFPVRLPTYPSGLGPPDGVFYQELGGPVVVLVWMNPERAGEAKYSLHILGEGAILDKGNPTVIVRTSVNGNPAAWTRGPYVLSYGSGGGEHWDFRRIVSDRVLVWFEDGLTYRLESNLTLEEAKRMAESLSPKEE